MPLTLYTSAQEGLLSSFSKIPNFRAKKFTFYNKLTGEVVVDAVSMDDNGRLLFKDKFTEVYFDELILKKQFITETVNEYDEQLLYFQDEFNEKVSLGEIYDNVQRFINSNLVFWHQDRISKALSGGLDRYIIEDVYTSYQELNVNDNTTVKDFITKKTDIWKNKWMDVPCMQLITPEYINGCMANITAKISMKVRNDKPLYTGFRIIDGTTGIELTRTVHASRGQHGKAVTYTIPLSYQGPLPDSEPYKNLNSNIITYNDIQNLAYTPNNNEFSSTPLDVENTLGIKNSTHVIKLQWITCDIAAEIMLNGEVTESLTREFDPDGNTSIELSLFSSNSTTASIAEINGVIDFANVKGTEYIHTFNPIPFGIEKGYTLNLSANKNVNLSVLSSNLNGFVISTNKKPAGLIVDWSISYNVNMEVDLNILNDTSRVLNHFLFKSKEDSLDFCNERLKKGSYTKLVGGNEDLPSGCQCCDCCTEDEIEVSYSVINGRDIGCYDPEVVEIDKLYTPYVYTVDSLGKHKFSYDLDYKFNFLAELKVVSDIKGNAGSSTGDGVKVPDDSYDFFSDLFSNAGLLGINEGDNIKYIGDTPKTKKVKRSPSKEQIFYRNSSNCSYSFYPDSVVTTKVVGEEENSVIYKILKAQISAQCDIPDDVVEVPIETIDIPVNQVESFDPDYQSGRDYTIVNSFSNIFSKNLVYGGIDSNTEIQLSSNMEKINNLKQLGLVKLQYDKLSNFKNLPAQKVSSNLIRLDLERNSEFNKYFENSNSQYLYTSNGTNTKSFINPNDGYLSISAFRHNLISFDPNPGILVEAENNTFFPTFDPIGNKKSLQEVLEYIYTAIYPTNNVPVFPNFRIGDIAINGALYNPLYDYRNFRTFGVYQVFKNSEINESVFVSDPISSYVQGVRIGKIIKSGNNYYQIKRDFNNSGSILTSISPSGVIQKVIPSGIIFKKVTQELFDLNPSLQVII